MTKKLKIAIIESPNPIDMFESRSEALALAESCKLIGHQTVTFFARSRREFAETINYLASSHSNHATRFGSAPLFLHISAHGDSDCIAIGQNEISWSAMAEDLAPLIENIGYQGSLALCLSSCGSGDNRISRLMQTRFADSDAVKLPRYIFSIKKDLIAWDLALVAWNLLYFKLSDTGITDKIR